jgi:hypothetical protein
VRDFMSAFGRRGKSSSRKIHGKQLLLREPIAIVGGA